MTSLEGLEVHEAASTGDYDTLVKLMKSGQYDVNMADEDYSNKTPLHWACQKGFVECARLLIENGAKGNARTETGWTPAHYAAEAGKLSTIRALHTATISIDKTDIYGCTPRRMAEIYGHEECVKYLLQAEFEQAERRKKLGITEFSDDDETATPVSNMSPHDEAQNDKEVEKRRKDVKQRNKRK